MFEISISAELVETQIEEILKRIEHAGEPATKEDETNIAWFQIFAIRKFIMMGAEIYFAINDKVDQDSLSEYRRVKESLNAALKKVEELYERIQEKTDQS